MSREESTLHWINKNGALWNWNRKCRRELEHSSWHHIRQCTPNIRQKITKEHWLVRGKHHSNGTCHWCQALCSHQLQKRSKSKEQCYAKICKEQSHTNCSLLSEQLYWLQLCQSIQTSSDIGHIRGICDGIKKATGPTIKKTAPLKT